MKKLILSTLFLCFFSLTQAQGTTISGTLINANSYPTGLVVFYTDASNMLQMDSLFTDSTGYFTGGLYLLGPSGTVELGYTDCTLGYTVLTGSMSAISNNINFGNIDVCPNSQTYSTTLTAQLSNTNGAVNITISYDGGTTYQTVTTSMTGALNETLNFLTGQNTITGYFYDCNNDSIYLSTSNISSSPNSEYFDFGTFDYCPVVCSAGFSLSQNIITGPGNVLTASGVTLVNNLSTGSNLTYTWNFGDGSALYTGVNFTHTYAAAGPYNLCLTVDDGAGCTDMFCDSLLIDTNGVLIGKTNEGFTIQMGDGSDETNDATTINNLEKNVSLEIYPNPSGESINISIESNFVEETQIRLYELGGKLVYVHNNTMTSGNQMLNINTEVLNSGLYILQLSTKNGVMTRKVSVR